MISVVNTVKRTYEFLLEVYNRFNEHNGFLLSAGIAFFTFFSLFPLLLFVGIVFAYALENTELQRQIIEYVLTSFPALPESVRIDIVELINRNIQALISSRATAVILAVISLLWSGTGLFGGLALGLNAVYEVKETRNIFTQRLLAIGVLVILIALFLTSFGATSAASVFRDEVLPSLLPGRAVTFAWTILSYAIGLVSTLLLFLVVYRLVPNVRLALRNVWLGTLTAGTLFEIGKYAFAFYLNSFATRGYGFVYGSLAAIVLFMFWLNISSMLLLIGAEINVIHLQHMKGGVKIFEPRKGRQQDI